LESDENGYGETGLVEYIHDRLGEVKRDTSMAIRDVNDRLTSIEGFIQGGAHEEGCMRMILMMNTIKRLH